MPSFYVIRSARALTLALAVGLCGGSAVGAPAEETKFPPVEGAPKEMDLAECYRLALKRSEVLQIQQEEIKAAEARYRQALSALMPQVQFAVTEQVGNTSSSSDSSGSSDTPRSTRKDQLQGIFTATQTIFNGFRDVSKAGAEKADASARRNNLTRSRQLLYNDLATLFYQVIGQERDLAILQQQREAIAGRVAETEERVKIGRSPRADLLSDQTLLANNRVLIEQVKGLGSAARELLAFLIGIESARIKLADHAPFPTAQQLDAYLTGAGDRPDAAAAGDRITVARKKLDANAAQHLPTLSAEGNYTAMSDPSTTQGWNILLTAMVPIFEGGLIQAQVREAQAQLRASKLDLARTRRLADNEVRTAYVTFIAFAAQYVELQKAEQTAADNYQTQKRDYSLGRAGNLDVLTALIQWTDNQRRRSGMEYQAKAALVSLVTAAGQVGP